MREPLYIIAIAYQTLAPGAYRFDGWGAFAEMCCAVKFGRPVRVLAPDNAEVSWHPRVGWEWSWRATA